MRIFQVMKLGSQTFPTGRLIYRIISITLPILWITVNSASLLILLLGKFRLKFLNYKQLKLKLPILTNTSLRLVKNTSGTTTNLPIFSDWANEFTYFKPEEIIPFLACQVIINQKSIPALMKLGLAKFNFNTSSDGTGNTQNLAQSVPLSANEVEVLSSVCIIESSHHSVGITNSTFCGQNGESFLTNLVENLVEADGFRHENCTVVNFHERTILNLKGIHIPFLFPAGMKLPTFFKEHLSDANGFNERSVNFGEYERTINGDEIFNFQVFC